MAFSLTLGASRRVHIVGSARERFRERKIVKNLTSSALDRVFQIPALVFVILLTLLHVKNVVVSGFNPDPLGMDCASVEVQRGLLGRLRQSGVRMTDPSKILR